MHEDELIFHPGDLVCLDTYKCGSGPLIIHNNTSNTFWKESNKTYNCSVDEIYLVCGVIPRNYDIEQYVTELKIYTSAGYFYVPASWMTILR